MPTYDYECQACKHSFEAFHTITARDEPCAQRCSACKKKQVARVFLAAPMGGVDKTLSPGADFKEMMNKMAKGVPERYREGLHKAADLRGGKLGTQ
jgi:putative FmdB family regulatory protein